MIKRALLSGLLFLCIQTMHGQVVEKKIVPGDGRQNWFGSAVSIFGDYVIVGARLDDDLVLNGGAAYIFHKEGMDWIQQQKIYASDVEQDLRFGRSVAMTADRAIVGAHKDGLLSGTGVAYLFSHDTTGWTEEDRIQASDGMPGDRFGLSVGISGDYAVIGAFGLNDSTGAAYVFSYDGASWVEQASPWRFWLGACGWIRDSTVWHSEQIIPSIALCMG